MAIRLQILLTDICASVSLIKGIFVIVMSATEGIVELIIIDAVLCRCRSRIVICIVLYCTQVQWQGYAWSVSWTSMSVGVCLPAVPLWSRFQYCRNYDVSIRTVSSSGHCWLYWRAHSKRVDGIFNKLKLKSWTFHLSCVCVSSKLFCWFVA